MKNTTKRLKSVVLLLILFFTVTALSGCYVVNSGRMWRVEGTYELTTYSAGDDLLAERGIKLVMVIRRDGTGYFVYSDNKTEPFMSELRCRFIQDEENPSKYSYVEIDFEGRGEYHKLAINAASKNLNSQRAVWGGDVFKGEYQIQYYIDVDFTRVSRATDLSYIEKRFPDAVELPRGAKRFDGTYILDGVVAGDKSPDGAIIPENPYVYLYVSFDFVEGSATIYSMKKSLMLAEKVTVPASIEESGGTYTVKIGEKTALINTYVSYQNVCLDIEQEFPYDGGVFVLRFYSWGDMTEENIASCIATDLENYMANNPEAE